MNKKALLIALPALMAISACSGALMPPKANNLMAEDTLAHEEIFGEAVEAGELGLKKLGPRKAPTIDADFSKIGYQINFNNNGAGEADDTISIRFVLALKSADVSVSWHRGLAQADGTIGANPGSGWKYKLDDGIENNSSKIYATLNNGSGSTITAGVSGEFEDYQGFAIYTLRNIPYEAQKDSYLVAYATITGDNTLQSQALAVKIEKDGAVSKNKFSFDPTVTGHFLQGKIGGVENSLVRATEESGILYASYRNVALDAADSFGSFYYSPSAFQFCGYSSYFGSAADYFDAASLGGYVSPKASGTKTLYVYSAATGEENCIHVSREVTLYLTANWTGWEASKAHAYNGISEISKAAWPGEAMAYVGVNDDNNTIFSYTVDAGLYNRLIFNNGGGTEAAAIDLGSVADADAYNLVNDSGIKVTKWGTYTSGALTGYKVIYFSNNKGWNNVSFHVFDSSTGNSKEGWRASSAWWVCKNKYNEDIYRVAIDTSLYDSFIFNSDSNQTIDIPLSSLSGSNNAFYLKDSTDGSGHFEVEQYEFDPLNPLA